VQAKRRGFNKNPNKMAKLIIFSAPSGAGKSTLVRYLLSQGWNIRFSISATSRLPRGEERNGVEYYFLTPDEFRERIADNEFLEYEEVYTDTFYGTLKSEVDRILAEGKNVVFDVDCVGGLSIKKIYGEQALSIFVMPPSVEVLRERLEKRGTDSPQVIENRLAKAEYEMSFAPQFDAVVCNDDYDKAKTEILQLVSDFISE
jgi:guanylate kinase